MNFKYFNEIVNLISIIFAPEPYHIEKNIEEFQRYLSDLETGFRTEISENIYHTNSYPEKENLIKRYVIYISKWYFHLLNSNTYGDEDDIDHLAPEIYFIEIKNAFQEMINIICEECFTHSIDLIKICSESEYTKHRINLEFYYDKIDFLRVNNEESNQKKFKTIFTSNKAYDFYCYLLENFTHSELSKHSTIFFMMLKDGLIDSTIRPERYKRLLHLSNFKIEIKQSLKTLNSVGIKTQDKYSQLKYKFFEIK